MAYERHSHGSEWYIFPTGPEPTMIGEEELAIYHVSAMEPDRWPNRLVWNYEQLKWMADADDFSEIPGHERQRSRLVHAIRRFLSECEAEWAERESARTLVRK